MQNTGVLLILMDSLRQAFARTALSVADYVVPVLRTSRFKETGVITPDEFIAAGDFLVHHCPTWQWSSGDKPPRSYLPARKQYLVTRNVPCYKRISQIDNHDEELEKVVEDDEFGEGWVDTHHYATTCADSPPEMMIPSYEVSNIANRLGLCEDTPNTLGEDDDEDEEAEDMDAFVQDNMLDAIDPVAATPTKPLSPPRSTKDRIIETRTYDLYITYDKYYQTSRLWLYGYSEDMTPLTEEQMYEDFSQDHAKKTVTMEQHPHLSGPPMPSIHPCRQADVMRKLIETMADCGAELAVHQYIMVFLKFVQAVIPTIEYDYTRNFSMS
ncbi:unnamed protein product [Dicrocoelium dendriticum]|nr:unnamed protein product [Dicrocoelium dendriticum]